MDLPAGARLGNQRGEFVQCRFRGTGIGVRRRAMHATSPPTVFLGIRRDRFSAGP